MNTDFKINGQSYRFVTSAENVKYGSGTVKDALDDIKNFDTSGMSEFGKKLYTADEKEFKRLLKISSEGIWDTGQNRWRGTAIVTDDTTAHGGKVLSLAGSNLQTTSPITFGGDPFEIKFYGQMALVANGSIFRALGTSRSFGIGFYTTYNTARGWAFYYGTSSASTQAQFSGYTSQNTSYIGIPANTRYLYRIIYNGSGTVTIKVGGTTVTVSLNIPREPRRVIFGTCTGYIDDFELVDNGVVKSKLDFE